MTVQEDLFNILEPRGDVGLEDFPDEMTIEEIVIELLARHAHELAEKIRARAETIAGYDDAYRHAADFIDPEVTT